MLLILLFLLLLFSIFCYSNVCETGGVVDSDDDVVLLVAVFSAPAHVEKRSALRNTWFRLLPPGVEARFFVGQSDSSSLDASPDLHDPDVIRLDFLESYDQLAEKTRAVLRTSVDQFPSASFVFKTDDDVYLRPDLLLNIVNELLTSGDKTPVYLGHFHERAFAVRAPGAKFYEPGQRDCMQHLPYASGAGYLLSRSLASYLGRPPLTLRKFRLEDVAVGFWLAPLSVRRINVKFLIRPERDPNLLPKGSFCPEDSSPLVSLPTSGPQQWGAIEAAHFPDDAFLLQHRLSPAEIEQCFRKSGKPNKQ